MKVRMLAFGLLALLGLAGCAHQPLAQGGTSEAALEATPDVQGSEHATTGLEPYQQILSDPGPF